MLVGVGPNEIFVSEIIAQLHRPNDVLVLVRWDIEGIMAHSRIGVNE